jgi:hypothetical protein
MLIDVLVEHNLGEYIAGLLTGYSPGSSLSPKYVATAILVGGDYAWLSHVIRYSPKISQKCRIIRDDVVLRPTTDGD